MPRVSILIPTYNRAHFLSAAIESILAQELSDPAIELEIIVADDGSTDNTGEVVARFGSRVKYLSLPHRGQPAAPRNSALAAATGDYIAFLDSDDLFLPQKLALQIPILDTMPDVGVVYSDGIFFDTIPDKVTGQALAGLNTPSGSVFGELLRANFIFMPLILVRHKILKEAGGFDERPDLLVAEDYDLWLRLAMQTNFYFVPGNVAAIRVHPDNISANTKRVRQRIVGILQRFDAQYPELMQRYTRARHEAYAINHGAIAQAALQQHQWGPATRHSGIALWHMLHLPACGIEIMRTWSHRHRLRASPANS